MIKHVLADGTQLDSIEGRVIPAAGATEAIYKIVANFIKGCGEPEGREAEERRA